MVVLLFVMLLTLKFVAPTFANVIVWLAEVVFIIWLPNSKDVVLRDAPTTDWLADAVLPVKFASPA